MTNSIRNLSMIMCFGIAVLLSSNAFSDAKCAKEKMFQRKVGSTMTVSILPPGVSKSLKMTPIPHSTPTPYVIGSGWHCDMRYGFEVCHPYIVFCTKDGSVCSCTSACP